MIQCLASLEDGTLMDPKESGRAWPDSIQEVTKAPGGPQKEQSVQEG